MTKDPGGISLPSVTRAEAPTSEPAPIFAPLSSVAPMPIRLPPSIAELDRRLRSRGQDSDEVIAGRMAKSQSEISHWAEYDYVIVNSDIDQAFNDLLTILQAERMRRDRQPGLAEFVRGLNREFDAR